MAICVVTRYGCLLPNLEVKGTARFASDQLSKICRCVDHSRIDRVECQLPSVTYHAGSTTVPWNPSLRSTSPMPYRPLRPVISFDRREAPASDRPVRVASGSDSTDNDESGR